MSVEPSLTRRVWAEIDLDAVRTNVRTLAAHARPAELLAVVKADGYNHGAERVARAALDAGATWLGVATAGEGSALRGAGIDAPMLVLSEPPHRVAADAMVQRGLTPVVYSQAGIDLLAAAVRAIPRRKPFPVHLKVDTGMHRVGCLVEDAVALTKAVAATDELRLEGICTHLAVADETDNPYTDRQLDRFDELLGELDAHGLRPRLVHASNSAALLCFPRAHYDLVRIGIAVYGVPPAPGLAGRLPLLQALALKARVAHTKTLPAGARVSYGLRYTMPAAGTVATVPVGYADGVPRNLGIARGGVLIGGRRHPIAGAVTMDQLMVDCGDAPVEIGDEVVLLGRQGDDGIGAAEWAERLGTIAYEIVCGIGPRVPRRYSG
jgi:alanine racemase